MEIVATGTKGVLPMSVALDAASQHLIESRKNLREARDEYDPEMQLHGT